MADPIGDLLFPIPCGNCRRKTKKTFRWMETHREFVCACGARQALDANQIRRELRKMRAALADVQKAFKAFDK